MQVSEKYGKLLEELETLGSVLVAYSGGVDSTLLAVASQAILGDRALAVLAVSDLQSTGEAEEAQRLAHELGLRHEVIETFELADPRVAANPTDRCYYCKSELFDQLRRLADVRGLEFVADGANMDDMSDHRPGHKAAAEFGVLSPLRDAGMTKADIREAARELGLTNWNKPSMACLASRVPYGTTITDELVARIATAERAVALLGFGQVRVRAHGEIARLEVPESDVPLAVERRHELASAMREAGFTWAALDLDGYRTGSMNAGLDEFER